MGWSFSKQSKESLIRELIEGSIDHALKGNTLYSLVESCAVPGMKIIRVDLIQVDRASGEVGNKAMDETMGPRVLDCPERLLAASTCNEGFAPEWRAKCRAERTRKGAAKKASAGWKQGDWLVWYGQVVVFQYLFGRGKAACVDQTGKTYAYRVSELAAAPHAAAAVGDETAHYRCEG